MKTNGGPAFPRSHSDCRHGDDAECVLSQDGMTLRDYFAAKAMQGLLASDEHSNSDTERVASWAYSQADAMLTRREK